MTALLERPVPESHAIVTALVRLESAWLQELPRPGSAMEGHLFDALAVMFVAPGHARRAREAVRTCVGDTTFEILVAYLAFVRTAHFWTEMHPQLALEADCVSMLAEHPRLAELVLGPSDADLVSHGDELRKSVAGVVTENDEPIPY